MMIVAVKQNDLSLEVFEFSYHFNSSESSTYYNNSGCAQVCNTRLRGN